MALMKQAPAAGVSAATPVIPATTEYMEDTAPFDVEEDTEVVQTAAVPVVQTQSTAMTATPSSAGFSAPEGFEGLELNFTSFATIKLDTDGIFRDIDNHEYGKEFLCRLHGSKSRYVYRANPVLDNKRDVMFSYDGIVDQKGRAVQDVIREWEGLGKVVEKRNYLEVLVELHNPGEPDDGEYRLLSVSPTSIGRFTGHVARAKMIGGGHPGNILTRVKVGDKVMKVQNPFYPWHFEIAR